MQRTKRTSNRVVNWTENCIESKFLNDCFVLNQKILSETWLCCGNKMIHKSQWLNTIEGLFFPCQSKVICRMGRELGRKMFVLHSETQAEDLPACDFCAASHTRHLQRKRWKIFSRAFSCLLHTFYWPGLITWHLKSLGSVGCHPFRQEKCHQDRESLTSVTCFSLSCPNSLEIMGVFENLRTAMIPPPRRKCVYTETY